MSAEIKFDYGVTGLPDSGATSLYVVAYNAADLYVYANGATIEAYNSAHWNANYRIALTEVVGTGKYVGTFPVVAAGLYGMTFRQQGGVSAVPSPATDLRIGINSSFMWSGTAEVVQTGNSFSRLGAPAAASVSADIAAIATTLAVAGTGTGARTLTVTVNDGATALQNARVRFTLGAATYVQTTNASGVATFNLDDGTWTVAITLIGYTFSGTTKVVSSSGSQTYSMTAMTLTPSDPGMITAYIVILDNHGDPVNGVPVYMSAVAGNATNVGFGLEYDELTATSGEDEDGEPVADGLAEFPNRLYGATYQYHFGTAGSTRKVTMPTSGTSVALDSIIGSTSP